MKCLGDQTKTFHCKIVLLDEQELYREVQAESTGQELLDAVYAHLNLLETAYFGMRFLDPSGQTHWLDANKKLSKQLKGTPPLTLYWSVKFYAADPTRLVEEITRYQFFLQVKQDIFQGRLPVSQDLAAELGAYAVQSELGDYDSRRHSPGYVSEFRFLANQNVALENSIAQLHSKLMGLVPAKAELTYLEKVKWLDMYGVDLHPVLGEDNIEYFLGLTPAGVIVLRNKIKVGNYFWPRITKVYFKGRFFMLRVRDKNNDENTYGFETPSKAACKHVWKCCVEHHAFFRLTQAAGNSPAAIFSLGSKFRFSGRTEKEAVADVKQKSRQQPEFSRVPSRRYQRRVVEGAQDAPAMEKESEKKTQEIKTDEQQQTTNAMHRSTSLTLAPRSDSPHSTRSVPARQSRPHSRCHSSSAQGDHPFMHRTSSVESQSSVDSRGHKRRRRSHGRTSDGESESSSKCSSSSKGHRCRHHCRRHRHRSNDSGDHHRHRHKSGSSNKSLVDSEAQWAQVQAGSSQVVGQTATIRDLSRTGLSPSSSTDVNHNSLKKRHRKHRSRSRSPSEAKCGRLPQELRNHLDFKLKGTEGMTEDQLKEIPYTRVCTSSPAETKLSSSHVKSARKSKCSPTPHWSNSQTTEESEKSLCPAEVQKSDCNNRGMQTQELSTRVGETGITPHGTSCCISPLTAQVPTVCPHPDSSHQDGRTDYDTGCQHAPWPQPSPQSSVTSGISIGSSGESAAVTPSSESDDSGYRSTPQKTSPPHSFQSTFAPSSESPTDSKVTNHFSIVLNGPPSLVPPSIKVGLFNRPYLHKSHQAFQVQQRSGKPCRSTQAGAPETGGDVPVMPSAPSPRHHDRSRHNLTPARNESNLPVAAASALKSEGSQGRSNKPTSVADRTKPEMSPSGVRGNLVVPSRGKVNFVEMRTEL